MAQQTAVEWLEIQFEKYTSGGVNVPNNKIFKLTEKAKQMERQQIEEAYINGDRNGFCRYKNIAPEQVTSEQYYKETYGGQGSSDVSSTNTQK